MSANWQKAYIDIHNFITANPGIKIRMNVVAVPEDVRHEFYRLFGAVREAFLKEKFPDLLNEAITLSRNYTIVEEEVANVLGLARVEIPASLNSFLQDPVDSLIRVLFDPLFNLLKGKIDAETFEQESSRKIERPFKELYRLGYENWVTLSLVKLLIPDKTFNISSPEIESLASEKGDMIQVGRQEPVPNPKESKRLSLEHILPPAFTFPDFIIHSVKLNRYVGINTEPVDASWTATAVSKKREWHYLNSIRKEYGVAVPWPDLIIYVDDNPEEITLVADLGRICRPDLVVECMEQKDWYEKEGMDRVKLHNDILKPKLGTYVVSNELVPEKVYKELGREQVYEESAAEQAVEESTTEVVYKKPAVVQKIGKRVEGIFLLSVGFDQSKLAPIIDAFTGFNDNDQ